LSSAERFQKLFNGLDRVYGRYDIDQDLSSRKVKVAGRARTIAEPVTDDLFRKHLAGDQGLGIVPIRDDQCCVFAAIDIDQYVNFDISALNKECLELGLPLIVCRTKSGGAHAYMFFSEPVRADLVRKKMDEISEALGHPGVEIFPKQKVLGRDDVGNWINLPYFNIEETDRFAYDNKNKPIMDLEKFCDYAEHMAITKKELAAIKVKPKEIPFMDGPPCLQRLAQSGYPDGGRNQGLFNVGVYCRKKYPDEWEEQLEEINYQFMKPPLKSSEVQTTLKSVGRKEYGYTCDSPPINKVCDKDVCLARKYGVGSGDGGAELESMLGGLRKSVMYNLYKEEIQDDNVTWLMDVDGIEIRLSTGDLFNQDRFRTKCAERLRKLPPKVRPQRWEILLKDKIESAELVEFPPETGTYGHIVGALKEFCTIYGEADTRGEILSGKVWTNEKGFVHFRHESFWRFLVSRRIYNAKDDGKQLHLILHNLGAEKKQLMIDSARNINKYVWCVKGFDAPDMPEATPPKENY
jgi:hypothetical protein